MRSCIPCGMLLAGAGFGFRYPPIIGRAYFGLLGQQVAFQSVCTRVQPSQELVDEGVEKIPDFLSLDSQSRIVGSSVRMTT